MPRCSWETFLRRAVLIWCCLCLPLAALAAPQIEYRTEQNGANQVHYPQIGGLDNAFAQDAVNKGIVETGKINEFIAILQQLGNDAVTGLWVDTAAEILPAQEGQGVLSARVFADGKLPQGPPGGLVIPLLYDLASGQAADAAQVFRDMAGAQAAVDAYLEETVAPELSTHIDAAGLTPAPLTHLTLDETGITIHYPQKQLALVSGRNGAVHIQYRELPDIFDMEPGSLLYRLGLTKPQQAQAVKAKVEAACSQGRLPGIPVKIGESLTEAIKRFKMPQDSGVFGQWTAYQLEDAAFRNVLLLAGANTDGALVEGIYSTRADLYGLACGQSRRAETLAALGPGTGQQAVDDKAQFGPEITAMDSYPFGANSLRLLWDVQETLRAVWLIKTLP